MSIFFGAYLSEISSYSVTSEKTDETIQMVCKVNSIFDEIFETCVDRKSGFIDFVKQILKK